MSRTPQQELSRSLAPADLARRIAELGSEPQACLLCGGRRPTRCFQRSAKWFWRCPDCTLVFVHDIYPEFLDDGELAATYCFDQREVADRRKRAKYDAFLGRLGPPSGRKLLEIGCGQGLFLAHARDLGWRTQGVEILPPVAAHARARGLEVFLGTLEEARFPDASFDVVVLREVIEHIVDPVALMREIRRVLVPGGVAALGTDNAMSWTARLHGARWSYYRFGGHLHIRFYSPRSALALARASGFATVSCHTHGFALREQGDLAGRWYRPLVKLAQGSVSPFARLCGTGQRLVMHFRKGTG